MERVSQLQIKAILLSRKRWIFVLGFLSLSNTFRIYLNNLTPATMNFYHVLQNLWFSCPVEVLPEKEKNNVLFLARKELLLTQRSLCHNVWVFFQRLEGGHYQVSAQWTLVADLCRLGGASHRSHFHFRILFLVRSQVVLTSVAYFNEQRATWLSHHKETPLKVSPLLLPIYSIESGNYDDVSKKRAEMTVR